MTTIDKQNKEKLEDKISKLAETLAGIPEVVGFYIMEYRKEYDRESLKGTKYEYLLEEDKELYEDL